VSEDLDEVSNRNRSQVNGIHFRRLPLDITVLKSYSTTTCRPVLQLSSNTKVNADF